ncbi:MAG: prepilin peptidase [Lachnospiraceae bacterium]|nr:prepilin peptidase [Lachnospiraceae bacterium]
MTTQYFIPILALVFLYGVIIGSFLNVCIYRIPKKENIAIVRSHCMTCDHQLKWYDNIPLISWIMLRGRCRYCKAPISPQYPIIEASNGLLWLLVFTVNAYAGNNAWSIDAAMIVDSLLYCLLTSALLTLSVIDFRTYEIPIGINIFILALGLIMTAYHYTGWLDHVIGFFAVSIPIQIIIIATKGRGFGGGDMKLMAVAGLMLGWKLIVLAFALGCIVGAPIHLIRMKVSGADRVLAMGPYLSVGIFWAFMWGNSLIDWYLRLAGF